MKLRDFIKNGAIWVPSLFAIGRARGQAFTFRDPAFVRKAAEASVGPCTTQQVNLTGNDANQSLGDSSANVYCATKWTASANYTACSVWLQLRNYTGSAPTNNIRAGIWSDSGDNPSALLGGWTSYYSADIANSPTWTDLGSLSSDVSIANGTVYWLVVQSSSVSTPGFRIWYYANTGNSTRGFLTDADGSGTWSLVNATAQGSFRLYSR